MEGSATEHLADDHPSAACCHTLRPLCLFTRPIAETVYSLPSLIGHRSIAKIERIQALSDWLCFIREEDQALSVIGCVSTSWDAEALSDWLCVY